MNKTNMVDIHQFSKRMTKALEKIEHGQLSAQNKHDLLAYNDHLACNENAPARRIKELQTLRSFAEITQKDFSDTRKEDLEQFLTSLAQKQEEGNLSIWTRYDYHKVLKKFFKWLANDTDVSWIKTRVPKGKQPKLARAEFLLEEEVTRLIESADNARDQAFISILWDYGARISEVGNLTWKDITFDQGGGVTTRLKGKTGERNPWAIDCVPALKRWHAITPHKEPDDPVWLANDQFKSKTYLRKHMGYSGLYGILLRTFRKSGLSTFEPVKQKPSPKEKYTWKWTGGKKTNPHLFRHSRALWAALHGWTIREANVFFGWADDSNMFAYYVTMVEDDAKRKMKEIRGLVQSSAPATPRYLYCPTCKTPNNPSEKWCSKCHALLDLREHQRQQEQMALSIASFVKQQVMNEIGKQDLGQYGAQGYALDNSASGGRVLFHDQPIGNFMPNAGWNKCEHCGRYYQGQHKCQENNGGM